MDNLLIYLVQSYNREALQILVEKYRKIIRLWANDQLSRFSNNSYIDYESIYNDLDIIMYKTIETFEPSKGVFYSYLKGAIFNSLMNYIRVNFKNRQTILSLEQEFEEDITLSDSLSSYDNMSRIIERYNVLEEVENTLEKIKKFKDKEQVILYLKMQGFSNEEIESMTDTNIRKVNYIFKKIRKM